MMYPAFKIAHAGTTIAFAVACCIAAITLVIFGINPKGIRHGLDLTARFSYLWFWLAYAGGALGTLFGLRGIARRGREFGLTFAAVHSVHLMLVLLLYLVSPKPPIALSGAVFFGVGIGFMYLLAIFSIRRISQMLRPWLWNIILLIAMEYIEYAFLADFWVDPRHPMTIKQMVFYLPFMLIGLLGTALRLIRWSVKFGSRLMAA